LHYRQPSQFWPSQTPGRRNQKIDAATHQMAHLEYVGSRKIAKTLPARHANSKHLEHMMEEARHATLLSKEAEKILARDPSESMDETLESKRHAESYLQAVDRGIEGILRDSTGGYQPFPCYLLTSLIIEERAMKFYPTYVRLLGENPIKETIQMILKDEVGHLEEMRQFCQEKISFQDIERARQLEEKAFAEKFAAVIRQLAESTAKI